MEKKKSIVGNVFAVIILTAIVAIFILSEGQGLFDSSPQDLYDMIEEEGAPVKGEYVTVKVDAVLDYYAETEHRINGFIPAGTDRHYLVWLDNGGIISLTVKGKKNFEVLDDITNDTFAYINWETDSLHAPVEFQGKIKSMNSEINGYYHDALRYYEINAANGFIVYELDIDASSSRLTLWLMLGFFALMDIIAIIVLIKEIKHNAQLKREPVSTVAYQAPSNDPVFGNMMSANNQSSTMTDDNNSLYK